MSDDRYRRKLESNKQTRLLLDLGECEERVTEALADDLKIDSALLAKVRTARAALTDGMWNDEIEREFYAASDAIRSTVFYPRVHVCSDLKRGDELISYAALSGVCLDGPDVEALSNAGCARRTVSWTASIEAAFYLALGRIALAVRPAEAATAGSEARLGARKAIRMYSYFTIPLTIVVIALSCLLYIASQLSRDVTRLVAANDVEAMRLHNELESHATSIIEAKQKGERELRQQINGAPMPTGPSSDPKILEIQQKTENELRAISNSPTALQIKDTLQQFAINNRELFSDVRRTDGIGSKLFIPVNNPYYNMNDCDKKEPNSNSVEKVSTQNTVASRSWLCDNEKIRANLEITVPMLEADHVLGEKDGKRNASLNPENDVDEGFQKIAAYQDIRAMAVYGRDIILSLVGIVTGFVLPVLYSWLGACASILRKINTECKTNTFHPENSTVEHRSHVTCAIIVGIAIGLMSDLIEGGKSLSPLAIAFVAGYASNKFFYFIDRLVDSLFPTHVASEKPKRTPNIEIGTSFSKREQGGG